MPTQVYGGFWQDLVGDFEEASFDGVLFDVFPFSREDYVSGESTAFFVEAARLLRPGGAFSFYFDAGSSWHEAVRCFEETSTLLRSLGFASVDYSMVPVKPRKDCPYFNKERFLLPLVKR